MVMLLRGRGLRWLRDNEHESYRETSVGTCGLGGFG